MGPPPVGLAHVAVLAAGAHSSPRPGRSLLSSSGLSSGGWAVCSCALPPLSIVLPGKPGAFLGTGVTGMSLGHILKTQNLRYVALGRGHLTAWARIGALRTPFPGACDLRV